MWKYIFNINETDKNQWHIKRTSNSSGSSFSPCTAHARSPPRKGAGVDSSVPVLSMHRTLRIIHMLKSEPLRWWYEEVGRWMWLSERQSPQGRRVLLQNRPGRDPPLFWQVGVHWKQSSYEPESGPSLVMESAFNLTLDFSAPITVKK